MGGVDITDVAEERRRRRRMGDLRLNDADRAILARITTGDLVDEFQAALDADLVADPILGGPTTAGPWSSAETESDSSVQDGWH